MSFKSHHSQWSPIKVNVSKWQISVPSKWHSKEPRMNLFEPNASSCNINMCIISHRQQVERSCRNASMHQGSPIDPEVPLMFYKRQRTVESNGRIKAGDGGVWGSHGSEESFTTLFDLQGPRKLSNVIRWSVMDSLGCIGWLGCMIIFMSGN